MIDVTTHIGILFIEIFIADSHSLKDKRMVLKRLKDQVRAKFNVSVAQLDNQDKWQTAIVGFSLIGTDNRYMNGALDSILNYIDQYHALEIVDHQIEFF